eukprot:194475-Amphidinium_carterae.1
MQYNVRMFASCVSCLCSERTLPHYMLMRAFAHDMQSHSHTSCPHGLASGHAFQDLYLTRNLSICSLTTMLALSVCARSQHQHQLLYSKWAH